MDHFLYMVSVCAGLVSEFVVHRPSLPLGVIQKWGRSRDITAPTAHRWGPAHMYIFFVQHRVSSVSYNAGMVACGKYERCGNSALHSTW